MRQGRHTLLFSLFLALGACGGGDEATDDPMDSGDTSDSDSDEPVDTGPQLPTDPRPVVVDVSGGWTKSITFDTPTCTNYPEGSLVNFRQFWRGSHNGVLIIEVLSNFAGAGTYNTTDHNLRVRLQSEAGTEYTMALGVDTNQGDSAELTIDHVSDIAWGQATVTGLHGTVDGSDVGAVTLTSPLPIYCPSVTSQ